jgi:hypothetical protein
MIAAIYARSVVIALLLVMSIWTATDALAECKCGLWESIMRTGVDFESDYKLHHAYETNALCESARQQAWEAKAASMEKEALGNPQAEVKKFPGEELVLIIKSKDGFDKTWTHHFFCLPESFKPRH